MSNKIEPYKSDFVVYPNPDGSLPRVVQVIVLVITVRNGYRDIKKRICQIPSYLLHCYHGIKSDCHKTMEVKIRKVMPL